MHSRGPRFARAWAAAAVLFFSAAPAFAQLGGLPQEITQAPELSDTQKATVVEFVQRQIKDLIADDANKIKEARQALQDPLRPEYRPSVAFRLQYGKAIGPTLLEVIRAATDRKDMAAVNALVLAGDLGVSQSVDAVNAGRESAVAAVRYQSADCARRIVADSALPARIIPDNAIQDLITKSGQAARNEQDPLVIDALLAVLATGVETSAHRVLAADELAQVTSTLTKGAAAKPLTTVLVQGLTRTCSSLQSVVQANRGMDAGSLKNAMATGGALLDHAAKVVQGKGLTGETERAGYASLVNAAQNLVVLAGRAAAPTQPLTAQPMGEALKRGNPAGDAEFVNGAQRLIAEISRPPFNVAPR